MSTIRASIVAAGIFAISASGSTAQAPITFCNPDFFTTGPGAPPPEIMQQALNGCALLLIRHFARDLVNSKTVRRAVQSAEDLKDASTVALKFHPLDIVEVTAVVNVQSILAAKIVVNGAANLHDPREYRQDTHLSGLGGEQYCRGQGDSASMTVSGLYIVKKTAAPGTRIAFHLENVRGSASPFCVNGLSVTAKIVGNCQLNNAEWSECRNAQ